MTKDELIEKALREQGIFPPSVLDSHYSDQPEMTKGEIIKKTLMEMDTHWSWGQGSQPGEEADHARTVVAELQRRLPDGKIKTCGAFSHLNAYCFDSCHAFYAHYDMKLIDLPDGGKAWVCCAMDRASYPERHAESMERLRNSPEAKLWPEIFGDDGNPKD
jgi:hypothetical protein